MILNNMNSDNSPSISPSVRILQLTPGKISWYLVNYAIFEKNHLGLSSFSRISVSVSSIKVVELDLGSSSAVSVTSRVLL